MTTQGFTSAGAKQGYELRRGEVAHYFDSTAAAAWARLTSDAPVSGIRATVRRGRDRMRGLLLSWLPEDLQSLTLLDAGCGTGALATDAAERGAEVLAIDLSPTLVQLARERLPAWLDGSAARRMSHGGSVRFTSGDMLDAELGRFDHVVAMDSLIHYSPADAVAAIERLAPRVQRSIVWTFAPRTPLLAAMHSVGSLFPRRDRAPSIVPVAEADLRRRLAMAPGLVGWRIGRSERVATGFYTSQAIELVRVGGAGP
jgi:magnesium-protoporphyrin O-methyltransferase